jgi:hypothetical protein
MAEHRIEMMRLGDLKGAPRNPKQHDLKSLEASLTRFGFVQPATIDERTGLLVAGHGRLEALRHLKSLNQSPPARVEVSADGDWLVPVLRGISFADEKQAEAYLLADNHLSEIGGWDEGMLVAMLKEAAEFPSGLDGIGWDPHDVEVLAVAAMSDFAGSGTEVTDPSAEWGGMPEYKNEDKLGLFVIVRFKDEEAQRKFEEVIGKKLPPRAKYLWFPEMEIETFADKRYVSGSKDSTKQ